METDVVSMAHATIAEGAGKQGHSFKNGMSPLLETAGVAEWHTSSEPII